MREISLHVLDLMENSVSAGAKQIVLRIRQDCRQDLFEVTIEDDGCGFGSNLEQVLSPFFTTKKSKYSGLGLSLVREAAESAGGSVILSRSSLGGASVKICMRLWHINRIPLGDLPATISAFVAITPDVDITCEVEVGGIKSAVSIRHIQGSLDESRMAIIKCLSGQIRMSLESLGVVQ